MSGCDEVVQQKGAHNGNARSAELTLVSRAASWTNCEALLFV
jgi:hypothetical protein